MKVLLTGAGGLIGSQVARQLVAGGDHVIAMLRPGESTARLDDVLASLEVRTLDLADAAALASLVGETRPDACVHPAWNAEPGKYLHSRENLRLVEATHRLAEALADHSYEHVVGVGTNAEYDPSYGYLSERTPTAPTYLYSACKLALSHSLAQLGAIIGRPELLRPGAIATKPGEPAFVCADNAKLRAETGGRAKHTLEGGLVDTVNWWRERA